MKSIRMLALHVCWKGDSGRGVRGEEGGGMKETGGGAVKEVVVVVGGGGVWIREGGKLW